MKPLTLFLSIICSTTLCYSQSIDIDKSHIAFEVGSMGFSSVDGKIKGMSGKVNFNTLDLTKSTFNVCVDPNTIDTENEERDEHLKNPDFFDVVKYPKLCFESTGFKLSGTKMYRYVVTGNLTIYNQTIEEKITFSKEGNTYTGILKVNRFDYNLGVKEYDGTFMVSDEVEIEIVCVMK